VVARALDTYKARLRSSIERTQRKLSAFEQRYGVSTTQFLNTMASEDLAGGDLDYVEWAGEARLLDGLQAELKDLEDAHYRLPSGCPRNCRPLRVIAIGAAVMILITVTLGCQAPQRVRSAAEQNRLTLEALAKGPVEVPAGEFLMGSTDADGMADADEKPQHRVYLDAFLIDRTEVTNAMYAKCVQASACRTPQSSRSTKREDYYGNPEFDNYPVVYVTWDDAQAYCAWAGGRLPTEAEWEKAARGANGRIYPWGNKPPDARNANYYASNEGDATTTGDATPVGAYPEGASPYGVLDMAGNAWEWVADWYGDTCYTSSPERNPTGPSPGETRVVRGGSWGFSEGRVRAAARYWNIPSASESDVGFRCARNP
jgi:formylglycine-generating enzyme required for sulfatase activity